MSMSNAATISPSALDTKIEFRRFSANSSTDAEQRNRDKAFPNEPSSSAAANAAAPTRASQATSSGGASSSGHFRPVRMRYLVLAEYSLLAFLNGWMWISFSVIPDETVNFFGITKFQVDMLSSVFYVAFIVSCFFALAFFDAYGCRRSLFVANICNVTSCVLKLVATLWAKDFGLLLFAQSIGGLSQSFFLPVPAALSGLWCSDDERTLFTTIASFANPLGGAAGFVFTGLFVSHEHQAASDFVALFVVMIALNLVDSVVLFFIIPSAPKHSPSEAAHIRRVAALQNSNSEIGICDRFKRVLHEAAPHVKRLDTLFVIIGTGLAAGAFWTVTSLYEQLLAPFGVGEKAIGWTGFGASMVGIPLSLAVGHYVDKKRIYKSTLLLTIMSIIVMTGLFGLLLYCFPFAAAQVGIPLAVLLGGPQNTVLPVGFEALSEHTFPLDENVCSTLILLGSEIGALIMMNALPAVLASMSPQGGPILVIFLLVLVTVIAFLFVLFGKIELKRKRASEALDADDVSETDGD